MPKRPDGAAARMADEASMPRDSGWANLRSSGHLSFDGEDGDFAASLSSSISLGEHLTSQLNLEFTAPADLMIGQHLIGMLNEAGYLAGDPLSLCETLKATPGTGGAGSRWPAPLRTGGRLCPRSRRMSETAAARTATGLDPAMEALVDNLPLVARRDFNALKSKCGVTMEDLQDMLVELRTLNPKPGHAFGTEPTLPVVPDVFVRPSPDGNWIDRTEQRNPASRPRQQPLHGHGVAVARRARTTSSSWPAATPRRPGWSRALSSGPRRCSRWRAKLSGNRMPSSFTACSTCDPITLKTVADAIEMHESTVSRVTSNKYIATPLGTYELKYFFTTAIANSDGRWRCPLSRKCPPPHPGHDGAGNSRRHSLG